MFEIVENLRASYLIFFFFFFVMIYQDSLEKDCRKYHNFSANLQRDFEMFCRDYFHTCPFSIDSIRFTK